MSSHRELADTAEAHQLGLLQITATQRHRARLQVMHAGRDLQERRQLLAALGLDGHDDIHADRNRRES